MSNIQSIADSQDWTDKTLLTLIEQFLDQNPDIERVICEHLDSCCEPEDEDETQYCQECGGPLEDDYEDGEICQECANLEDDDDDDEGGAEESEESVHNRASRLSRSGCVGLLESVGISSAASDTDAELREAVSINVLDNTIDWYCFDELCNSEDL